MYTVLSRRARGGRDRSRGQSLVEFALILPVMLALVAGALDLGRVFYARVSLHNAAREGAFQASQTPEKFIDANADGVADQDCSSTNTETNRVVCRVQLEAKGSSVRVAAGEIKMTCSEAGCPKKAGSTVTVQTSGMFRLWTPLLSVVFGGQDIAMTSSATAQLEYLPPHTTVTAPPAPVAAFTASDFTPRVGDTVTFTDLSSGNPSGWSWDFADGTFSSAQNPSHVFTSAGVREVRLTVVNLSGSSTTSQTITVTTSSPTPPPASTPAPTPTATPSCAFPPNVIGDTPTNATVRIGLAGFNPEALGDLTTGQKNKVQAQNPDHTQCRQLGTTITFHYRPNN